MYVCTRYNIYYIYYMMCVILYIYIIYLGRQTITRESGALCLAQSKFGKKQVYVYVYMSICILCIYTYMLMCIYYIKYICNVIYIHIFLYCVLCIHVRIFPKLVVSQAGGAPLSLVIMSYDEKLSQFGNYPFINPEYLPEFCSRL